MHTCHALCLLCHTCRRACTKRLLPLFPADKFSLMKDTLCIAGVAGSSKSFQPAATLLTNALYAILLTHDHCVGIMVQEGICRTMECTLKAMCGIVTTQLTAGACLSLLWTCILQKAKGHSILSSQASELPAAVAGSYDDIIKHILKALVVSCALVFHSTIVQAALPCFRHISYRLEVLVSKCICTHVLIMQHPWLLLCKHTGVQ